MKTTRKNVVIGIFAAVALVFSLWTAIAPVFKPRGRSGRRPVAGTAMVGTPALPVVIATTEATNAHVRPTAPIDAEFVRANLARWVESPGRDPFAAFVPPAPKDKGPRAAELLTLKGIWRQTGGRFAAINSAIVREGDRLGGFEIEAIENASVRVRGSNGVERIEFLSAHPRPPATNAPGHSPRSPGAGPSRERTLSP